ncbi:MAG TPA: DUF4136 domain-containing protein [Terracidiphilus sp.]|nr:DUF4136 domain-containing protein [Terracidiphilus sp.]
MVIPAIRRLHLLVFAFAVASTCASAQKVDVGYDKSVDFSRYKTYTLEQPAADPARPLLYANVVGAIQHELEARGLASQAADGDLTLILSGGVGYGLSGVSMTNPCPNCKAPLRDPMEWTGKSAPAGGTGGKPLPKGTLQVTFVDRATNKAVWSGTVNQKLDPDNKEKSLNKLNEAIAKLLAEFPPAKK